MADSNALSFFAANANPEIPSFEKSSKSSNEFKPNYKKAPGGVFKAVLRFVLNPHNPDKSIVSKYTCWLESPTTKQKMEVDCPSSVGLPDPLTNAFFRLRDSENAVLKQNASKFSSTRRFSAIVQIISCESDPSLVNKYLVWRFGTKVYQKIQGENNPPMGAPRNPFAIIDGRPMSIVVREVGGFANYDECQFFDADPNQVALRMEMPDAAGNKQWYAITKDTISTQEGATMALEYLKNNVPDLSQYDYRPWTPEVEAAVNEAIMVYTNPNLSIQAASSTASFGQAMGGFAQQPTSIPTMGIGQPVAATAPSVPTMGAAPAAPVAQPMGGMQMPVMGQSQVFGGAPAGFSAPGISADVNNMISGATQGEQTAPSVNAGNMDLNDILNGQML